MRHCSQIEMTLSEDTAPENASDDYFERTQQSIDRARASAQRTFHRSLNELRRLQTERQIRNITGDDDLGMAACREVASFRNKRFTRAHDDYLRKFLEADPLKITKQSQSAPVAECVPTKQTQIARSAPCPCGSGNKYKRCCGKDAPGILGQAA